MNFSGVMIDFKGMLFYFSSGLEHGRIGHVINLRNDSMEFVPLKTKFPLQYCDDLPKKTTKNESCMNQFYFHQVLAYQIYFDSI